MGGTAFLTQLAIRRLNRTKDAPSFLWLHYLDPHLPYAPPAEFVPPGMEGAPVFANETAVREGKAGVDPDEREWIRALYDAEVRYVDSQIGVLVQALNDMDLYEESLIILMSDHGEEFWDHGGFEHGHTMYRELLSVPLMVKLPHSTTVGTVETLVATEGLTPTILELCDIDYDPGSMTSPSLGALLKNPASRAEDGVVVERGNALLRGQERGHRPGTQIHRECSNRGDNAIRSQDGSHGTHPLAAAGSRDRGDIASHRFGTPGCEAGRSGTPSA